MGRLLCKEDFPDLSLIFCDEDVFNLERVMFGNVSTLGRDILNSSDEESVISVPFATCR